MSGVEPLLSARRFGMVRELAMEVPVQAPMLLERLGRWLFLFVGTVPLAVVVFQPLPIELADYRWLWLSAGALLTARVWLRDVLLHRLTRFTAQRQAIALLPLVVLLYTPVGGWLVGVWSGVPFLIGVTGGVIAAALVVCGWFFLESDFFALLRVQRWPVLTLAMALFVPAGLSVSSHCVGWCPSWW